MDPLAPPSRLPSVLFVCLGNICRSPLAEGVMRHRAAEAGLAHALRIDSAGTGGWHVGEPPDPRSVAVAAGHGVSLDGQAARRVAARDFHDFDWIVAMDRSNLEDLSRLQARTGGHARLARLRDFDPEPGDGDVPDPYYGEAGGFERVFAMIDRSCAALLERLRSPG